MQLILSINKRFLFIYISTYYVCMYMSDECFNLILNMAYGTITSNYTIGLLAFTTSKVYNLHIICNASYHSYDTAS